MKTLLLSLSATFFGTLLALAPVDAVGIAKDLCDRNDVLAKQGDAVESSANSQSSQSQAAKTPLPSEKVNANGWTVVDYRVKGDAVLRIPISYELDCKAGLVKTCTVNKGDLKAEVTSKATEDGQEFQATVGGIVYLLRCDEADGARKSLQKKMDFFVDELCKGEWTAEQKKRDELGAQYKPPSPWHHEISVEKDLPSDRTEKLPVTLTILCFAPVPVIRTCTTPDEQSGSTPASAANQLIAAKFLKLSIGGNTSSRRRILYKEAHYDFECLQNKAPRIIWDNYVDDLCKSQEPSEDLKLLDGLPVTVAFKLSNCGGGKRPDIEECTATIKDSGWLLNTRASVLANEQTLVTYKQRTYTFMCNRHRPPTFNVRYDFTPKEVCAKLGKPEKKVKDKTSPRFNEDLQKASDEEKKTWAKTDELAMQVSVKNEVARLEVTIKVQCHHPAGSRIKECVGKGDTPALTATAKVGKPAASFTRGGVEYTIECDPDHSPKIMKKAK